MVRRIITEDIAAPSTTVVEGDGSWVGRTIVALVAIAALVFGGIWLVNAAPWDNNGNGNGDPSITNNNGDTNVNPPADNPAPDVQPT